QGDLRDVEHGSRGCAGAVPEDERLSILRGPQETTVVVDLPVRSDAGFTREEVAVWRSRAAPVPQHAHVERWTAVLAQEAQRERSSARAGQVRRCYQQARVRVLRCRNDALGISPGVDDDGVVERAECFDCGTERFRAGNS